MRIQKKMLKYSIVIIAIMIIGIIFLEWKMYLFLGIRKCGVLSGHRDIVINIFLGILGSAVLTCFTSFVSYNYSKINLLTEYYEVGRKVIIKSDLIHRFILKKKKENGGNIEIDAGSEFICTISEIYENISKIETIVFEFDMKEYKILKIVNKKYYDVIASLNYNSNTVFDLGRSIDELMIYANLHCVANTEEIGEIDKELKDRMQKFVNLLDEKKADGFHQSFFRFASDLNKYINYRGNESTTDI